MALNEDNIYRYNFSSESNINWNFQLQFLRGKNTAVGVYATDFIPDDAFVDEIVVLNSYKDDIPIGMPQSRTLKLNIALDRFTGDFATMREWIIEGGQIISSVFYPNQWRLLSNNGRGASDVNYNIVEFWGSQSYKPQISFKGSFGDNNLVLELNILGVEYFLLNKNLNLFGLYLILLNNSEFLEFINIDSVYQLRKTGTNSSTQSVDVRVATDYLEQTAQFHTIENINYALQLYIDIQSSTLLREWLNKNISSDTYRAIIFDNLITKHFTFYEQLNTLSKIAGSNLLKGDELFNVFIRDTNDNIVGGLFDMKSKNSANQFKTIYDLLNNFGESFINKYIFAYLPLDEELVLPYFAINNIAIFDDYMQVEVTKTLTTNDIIEYEILDKEYIINFVKSSWYATGDNQNNLQLNSELSLIDDSHEFKSLITTALQMSKVEDGSVNYFKNIEMPINQIYYEYQTSDAILVHTKTDLDLGDSIEITSDEDSSGSFDFTNADDKGKRWSNWRDIIEYTNSMNNNGGLNYMQCKALQRVYNTNAKLTKLSVIDYKIRQQNLGAQVTFDFNTLSDLLPSDFYKTNKNIIVSCETNYRNGISKVHLYTRG